jgi:large subunit GTPase 1
VNTQEMSGLAPEVFRPAYGEAIIVEPVISATTFQKYSSSDYDFQHLKIPRKPAWTTTMTAEEVDANERNDFLKWRRHIAELEDKSPLRVTPFEKNLEVWRQLWRVIERSDIAVQVVDARNPLLYF